MGANQNVAAAVYIGIEPTWTKRIVEEIARSVKPVEGFWIERFGDLKTLAAAARVAQHMLQDASELRRVRVERQELIISIKCGESDTTTGLGSCPTVSQAVDRHVNSGGTIIFGETSELTGGEHLIAARCADEQVRRRFQAMYDAYIAEIESSGANLLGSQPTQGNIRGGLETIEEKSMGNIANTGQVPGVARLE